MEHNPLRVLDDRQEGCGGGCGGNCDCAEPCPNCPSRGSGESESRDAGHPVGTDEKKKTGQG